MKQPDPGPHDPGRRRFLMAGAAAAAGALLPAGCARPGRRAPNVVLVLTDDQAFDAIGYASGGAVITPNLDRFAAAGTRFDAAYCNAMPCTPSRGGIMSGLHWHRWRPLEKQPDYNLAPGEWTWAHALQRAGWATALIGKMHFRPMRADHGFQRALYCEHRHTRVIQPGRPLADDYEQWLAARGLEDPHRSIQVWPHPTRTHPISWVRDRAIEYLQQSPAEPFHLTVSFRYPHPPYDPPREFTRFYHPSTVHVPDDHWLDMQGAPPGVEVFEGEGFYPRDSKPEQFLRTRLALYFALVTQIDEAVGEIAKHVDLETTLVIFTSDHGVYLGRRGRIGKHPFIPFEPVARVPLFAFGRGVPAGARVASPVGLIDLAPTFLRAAGLPLPDDLDGEPLQPYFEDPGHGEGRSVFCWGVNGFNMTRRGPFKYFRGHDRGRAPPAPREEMLFDLASDPGELVNRASDPALGPVREELERELDAVERRPPSRLPRFARS